MDWETIKKKNGVDIVIVADTFNLLGSLSLYTLFVYVSLFFFCFHHIFFYLIVNVRLLLMALIRALRFSAKRPLDPSSRSSWEDSSSRFIFFSSFFVFAYVY